MDGLRSDAFSGCRAGGPIKKLAGFQHRMHDNGEFARNGDRSSLEADLFPQLQPPGSKRTIGKGSRQDHCGSLIKQTPQMIVAAPRNMPIEISFARLIAPGCEAQPRAHSSRCPEVIRGLDRRGKRGCDNRAHTRYRHE